MTKRLGTFLLPVCVAATVGCTDTREGGELTTGISSVGSADPTGSSATPDPTDGSPTADPTAGSATADPTGGSATSGNPSTAGDTSESASGMESVSDSGASDGVKFDTPRGAESQDEGSGGQGCDKIDFLFVIDNSGSMQVHQTNLINSFGPFIDTILSTVSGNDYRIMVLDSDACYMSGGGGWPPMDPPFDCNNGCDGVLGAGQVRGCNVPGGVRYLASALDAATLKSTFQCVANVGITGSGDEMVISALVDAIGPLNEAGQCNEGFVRDDAILVVTIISDDHSGWAGNDNENGFGGTPQEWFDKVIAVKGKVENVVVLGLYALLTDQSCIDFGPQESDQFIDFTKRFGSQAFIGSVCAPNYDPFFKEAVALIDTTCENFVPPE